MTEILAVVADTHCNSVVALCPPTVNLDDGGTYRYSKAQGFIWRSWLAYWRQIEQLKQTYNAVLYCAFVGDILDRGSTGRMGANYQIVTPNETTILEMTRQALDPALSIADHLLFCRGTEYHAGKSGHLEVKLAEDLDALEYKGSHAPWGWYIDIAGVNFDLFHHPQTSSRRSWTRGSATARQAKIVHDEYRDTLMNPPDVAIRAHVHYFAVSGRTAAVRVEAWQCPAWQLTPAYGYRLGSGVAVEPIGGLYFICEDGEYTGREILYRAPHERPYKLSEINGSN